MSYLLSSCDEFFTFLSQNGYFWVGVGVYIFKSLVCMRVWGV